MSVIVYIFRSAVMHRFWYNKNGARDLHLPRLNFWYFSYRVFKRAHAAGLGRMQEKMCTNLAKEI